MFDQYTRMMLVTVAERLYVKKDIYNVSLCKINRAPGQRNVTALRYHFSSRKALLEEIFEQHVAHKCHH